MSCSGSGCTLGGIIVIDTTAGTAISADISMGGESPTVGPFTSVTSPKFLPTEVELLVPDSAGDLLLLDIDTISLVGFDGGALTTDTVVQGAAGTWTLTEGALTPVVTSTPEPATGGLLMIGVGLLRLVMRKRLARGLQKAT